MLTQDQGERIRKAIVQLLRACLQLADALLAAATETPGAGLFPVDMHQDQDKEQRS